MHKLTQTTLDESTLIKTSVASYIFTCPLCDLQRRYAYSFDDKIEVFCNGEDFGTKFVFNDEIYEEAIPGALLTNFITHNETDDEMFEKMAEKDGQAVVDTRLTELAELEPLGLVEKVSEKVYKMTYKGFLFFDDFSKKYPVNPGAVSDTLFNSLSKLRQLHEKNEVFDVEVTEENFAQIGRSRNILERSGFIAPTFEVSLEGKQFVEKIIEKEKEAEAKRISLKVANELMKKIIEEK